MSDGPVLLFAGPSLWPDRPPLPRNVVLRPPARCGDLLRAARSRPRAILLADGIFETGPSVWHKEILLLLEAGIAVYGAASLGALRAAELDQFGMVGIGEIYQGYRSGAIERDDAVMVAHAPAELGHAPLTLALVDAEASLAAGPLAPALRDRAIRIARALPFRARSWPAIFARLGQAIGAAAAQEAQAQQLPCQFSQKCRDLARLIALAGQPAFAGQETPAPPRAPVARTVYVERLIRASGESEPGSL